jgi:hypothetical protein
MRNDLMNLDALENYLRSTQPRLICRVVNKVDNKRGVRLKFTPYISEVDRGWDEVIDEGYDPIYSPLGCPVYWRIVNRGDERFYLSTCPTTRDQIISFWGVKGLSYCDPVTGIAVARTEGQISRAVMEMACAFAFYDLPSVAEVPCGNSARQSWYFRRAGGA